MKLCKTLLIALPLSIAGAPLVHASPLNLFGCNALFGSTGQTTWLVGVDLEKGNLLTTKLTTDKVSHNETQFAATSIDIRNHIIGSNKTEYLVANDSQTFCKNLSLPVGSQLQIHWKSQDITHPQIFVQGGGEPQIGCFYGTINDPFGTGRNPFIACSSQGPSSTPPLELIDSGFKKLASEEVKSGLCGLVAKNFQFKYHHCEEIIDNLPNLYPNFIEHLNTSSRSD